MKTFYLDIRQKHVKAAKADRAMHMPGKTCPVSRAAAEQCEVQGSLIAGTTALYVGDGTSLGQAETRVANYSQALRNQVQNFDVTGEFKPGRYRLTAIPRKQEQL